MNLVEYLIKQKKVLSLDPTTGEIKVVGPIDFEEETGYELRMEAKDGFGLSTDTKVIIEISDVNDNAPVILLKSLSNPVSESAPPGTEVGIVNLCCHSKMCSYL